MLAAGVGHALERLRRTAVIATASATGKLAIIVNSPPRRPCAESVIAAIRRRVIRRVRRDGPVSVGIGETAAGVVFSLDRDIRLAANKEWSLGFDLCRYLKFRPPKLLDLKLMLILDAAVARNGKIDMCVPEVRIVRD